MLTDYFFSPFFSCLCAFSQEWTGMTKTQAHHQIALAKCAFSMSLLWLLLPSERSEERRTREHRGDLIRKGHVFLNPDARRGRANACWLHEAARCVASFVLGLKGGKMALKKRKLNTGDPDRAAENSVFLEITCLRAARHFGMCWNPCRIPQRLSLWILQNFVLTQYQKWPLWNLCVYELLGSRVKWMQKHLKDNLVLIRKQHY